MTMRDIIIAPDPRLKAKSEPVETVDDDLRALMDDMLETMYDAPGIGLAAIQLGVAKRVIVTDLAKDDEDPDPHFFINPEITWASEDLHLYEEGCLSLPEYYEEVERPAEIKVSFLDYHGKARELHCKEMLAVCVQHEIDHLEGILFVDHLTRLKRQMILRKLTKAKKLMAAENA
jgi:peptide deformylase